MHIHVDRDTGALSLREPDVFTRFHVEASGGDIEALAATLGTHGYSAGDGKHLFISSDAVRGWAAGGASEAWEEGFSKMLDYARAKGWLDEAGTHIRAHVEWASAV